VLSPEAFAQFWDACGKTGGGGFAELDAVTGEKLPDAGAEAEVVDQEVAEAERKIKETLHSRDGKVVGIARGEMRRLFLEGCEPHMRWSHHVTGYELTASGVRAVFADGTRSVEGQMLIGGEGISSKVAKQVSGGRLKVYDTGARGIHGQAPTTAFKQLGEGVWRLVDDSKADGRAFVITNVRAGDMDDASVQFGWTMGAQPGVIKAPNDDYSLIGEPAARIARDITRNWHPSLKPLFDEMRDSEAAFWKITCSTPRGVPVWTNDPRVTVIGDAVHSMTPAGGIGANTAVRDSALLGRLIGEAGGFREGLTDEYERQMRVYASEAVATSYGLAKAQFGIVIDEHSTTL
jgi:2-polyprenyl-6-methoxyphenol hydroxylase-like FAD-dependent oxidoreductase